MKKLLSLVLSLVLVVSAIANIGFILPISAESAGELIVCSCDSLTGWTKLNGDKTFVLTENRAQAQSDDGAIGTNVGYGFLQAYYEFPEAVDVSDYTAIEWDVGYTGSNGISEVLNTYAEAGYVRIFSNGNSPTDNQSNSLVFRFDSLEVTSINTTWAHVKATFEDATVKRNFDPTALTAFRFYTSENTYINTVANGAMRLDNIKVTDKEVEQPDVEIVNTVVTNCDTIDGWTKLNGDKTFTLTENRAQAQSDDGAVGTNVSYGFLQAYYTLPEAMDITGYKYIEWDSCFTNGMWASIAEKYASGLYLRLFSDSNDPTNTGSHSLIFDLASLEVTAIDTNWVHIKAALDNPKIDRDFNPEAFTTFRFYTNENTYDADVPNGAIRFDNIMVTGKEVEVEPEPPVETVDTVVTNCDTIDGWTKLNGDQTFTLTENRAQAQSDDGAVGTNVSNGFLKAYYTLPEAMDITGYKYIEWDSCFTNGMWASIAEKYADQLYLRLFSDENDPTNNQSNSLVFNLSKLEVSTIDANWVHIKAPLDDPSIDRNFNPEAFTAFRFYTNENTNDASVPSGAIRFDNIKVTGKEVQVVPEHKPGDINDDGAVNNKDLARLLQFLSGWDVNVNEAALDVNGDSAVNNKDITRLFQYLSNWDVTIS